MKKIITLLLVSISLISVAQYGNDYLRIGDVRYSWSSYPGSIDTAVFEIKPKGLYTEIGVYLDISTRGTNFVSGDSLEIQMSFKLPDKADVTDMWLWIGDSIVKADVYDKWTASQIYEDIVSRRVDPAILYKYKYEYWDYDYYYSMGVIDMYMLRIFPLMTNLPRKVKFTYLIPTEDLNTRDPYINLPVHLLSLSNQNIQKVKIRFFGNNYLSEPSILGNPTINFTQISDPILGLYQETILTGITYNSTLSLSFKNHYSDQQFTGSYNNINGEDFYQLNLIPNKIFNLDYRKKAVFLFDFIDANCNMYSTQQMLNELKTKLHSSFAANDSFNIMISGMITQTMSGTWLPADSLTIENTFNSLQNNDFNPYSSLPTLLIDGINFVKENNNGSIILITSSNSNGSYQQANDLIQDYLTMIGATEIPIHILDLDDYDNWQEAYYIGNQPYFGNEYLYINLSMQTIGEYFSLQETAFNVMLSNTFQKLTGYFSSFDLYIGMENGYTYANYDLSENLGIIYLDQPIQKIGKYSGNGRFKAIVSAQMATGEFFHSEFFIEQTDVIPMDSTTRTIWAAHVLRILKSYNQTNTTVGQIINMSIQERVLTDYTAFLALEPGEGQLADDGQVGGIDIGIEEKNQDIENSNISVYPNPSSEFSYISYTLSERNSVKILVYDIFGKLITTIDEGEKEKGVYQLLLNVSKFSQGTYICKIIFNNNISKPVKFSVIR